MKDIEWRVFFLEVCILLLCVVPSTSIRLRSVASVCYECRGGFSDQPNSFCALNKLVVNYDGCTFVVHDNGTWSSGGATGSDFESELNCTYSGGATTCTCKGEFCNRFATVTDYLTNTFWPSSQISSSPPKLKLPSSLPTECFECGQLNIPEYGEVNVTCDMDHMCRGDFCVSERGSFPHSYCGSLWTGSALAQCISLPGQPEICTCTESLCNALYSPLNQTTKPATSVTSATTTKPTAGGKTPCPQGRLSDNPQAAWMGEKLKEIIDRNFGADKVGYFNTGIDRHICDYSASTPANSDG